MSRQYIFKLTPNKKNVFINTSVLEQGKYADVTYPIQTKENKDLSYTIDKDTYKFIDTDIADDIMSKVYPVSMDISINIPDIPFYAFDKCLSNYSIALYRNSDSNENTYRIYDVSVEDPSLYHHTYDIDITVNWSDKSNKEIEKDNISYTIWIEKLEKIPSDKQEFSDLSTYLDLVQTRITKENKDDTKSLYNNFIKKLENDSSNIITYDSSRKEDDNIICLFRDSLYETRRAVATLKIRATYFDHSTGRTVSSYADTVIYQQPYIGKKLSYTLQSFVDYTQPLELFSPQISYEYVHDDNANDKLDSSTYNIKSLIKINASIIANESMYNANKDAVNTYCHMYNEYDIYSYDASNDNIFLNEKNQLTVSGIYIDNFYYNQDTGTYTTDNIDEFNFIKSLEYCMKLSDAKRCNNESTIKTSTIVKNFGELESINIMPKYDIDCTSCAISIYAVYPKYYINEDGEYQHVIIDNTDYYRYENDEYYLSDLCKNSHEHGIKINDSSVENNIVTYYIDKLKNKEWKDKEYNIHSMQCINDPINTSVEVEYVEHIDTSVKRIDASVVNTENESIRTQVPVYAAYPILTAYIPNYTYEYEFTGVINTDEYTINHNDVNTIYNEPSNVERDEFNNLIIKDELKYIGNSYTNNKYYYIYDIPENKPALSHPIVVKPKPSVNIFKPGINSGLTVIKNIGNIITYGTGTDIDDVILSIDIPDNHDVRNYLRINGKKCIEDSLNVSPYIFSISLDDYSEKLNNETFNISIKNNTEIISGKLLITNDEGEKSLHNFNIEGKDINNNMESFMLLRANPKLSGNIKLVVDSDYNLYIDTFKSSDKLNDSRYRKYPISADGNYPRDIKTVFKSLPISEIYKTPANSLNAHKIYRSHDMQFETMYEYGAETNKDILYSENMRILAPLHIGKHIPQFFTIFRYDGVYNEETYNGKGYQDTDKFIDIITKSSVISTIDLRQYTSIGQYLNNYKDMLQNYGYGQCGLQFIEQDNIEGSESYRQGKNIWKGILIKNGILSEQTETSYFANKILSDNTLKNKQELFNNYIQSGFERHGLLYPNIINLEFMFNDNDNDEYTMHRYFGLYLYENDFINYNYITDNIIGHNNVLQKYDMDGKLYKGDLKIFKDIFNNNYTDRFFYAITDDKAVRVNNETDINEFLSNNIKDKPEYNIVNVNADPLEFDVNQKSFITIFINQPIKAGEHIKIVLMNVVNDDVISGLEANTDNSYHIYNHIVYELIASDDIRLRDTENNINPYVTTNVCDYNDIVTFNRISFYTQNTLYPDITASVDEQIKRIIAAISLFEQSYISVSYHDNNSISLISSHNETYIQHIAAPVIGSLKYDYLHVDGVKEGNVHICTTNNNCTDSLSYISDKIEHNIQLDSLIDDECYNYIKISGNKDIESSDTYNYFSYVEAEEKDNIIADTFSYFNNAVSYNMKALSNITEYFDLYYVPFSNYEFETIGWRHNNVVKFMSVKSLPHTYVLYNDIEQKIKGIASPLVFTNTGLYESVHKFDIISGYYTNNVINPKLYGSYILQTQQFKEDMSIDDIVTITNPFNSNYKIICSDSNVLLTNNVIRLYKPKSASIAVMGISNIKDLDTNVEVKSVIHRENKQSIQIIAGDRILCDESDIRIQHGVMYKVTSGTLVAHNNIIDNDILTGTSFIIMYDNDTIVIYIQPNNKYIPINMLIAKTDVTLTIVDKQKYQEYNYSTDIPTIKLDHFFTDVDNTLTSDLMYPVVPLVNCAWESTGLYLDDNNIIDVSNLQKDYVHTGHFTENVFTSSEFESNQYVINKIDNLLYVDGKRTTFRECILDRKLSHAIKKLFINDVNINTAVCHYNHNTYSLEFIYFGIKFVLQFNDKRVNTHLHLDAYNNYQVFILNEYDVSKRNEMFISMSDEFILLINHQFYIDYAHEADNNVKDINDYIGYAPYSTISNISTVDFSTLYNHNGNLYGHIYDNKGSYNKHIDIHNLWSSWFIQEGTDNYIYSPLESIMTRDNQIQFIDYNNEHTDKYYYSLDTENKNNDIRLSYIMTKADGDYNHQITQVLKSIDDKIVAVDKIKAENVLGAVAPVRTIFKTQSYIDKLTSRVITKNDNKLVIDKKYRQYRVNNDIKDLKIKNISSILEKPVFNILDTIISKSENITDDVKQCSTTLLDRSATELQKYVNKLIYVETAKDKMNRYINSVTDNINIYVIPVKDDVQYIQNTTEYNPIMFNLSIPNYIKYNYGWFRPHTNNMVEYNIDDISLGKIIDVDLLCANTSVKHINKLINYTGNKVFNKDKSNVNYNYFIQDTHSLLSSTWDNAFYRLYTSDNMYDEYDGQLTGIDDKSFFGSRCMVIRNPYILIDTYNYKTSNDLYNISYVDSEFNTGSGNTKCLKIEINISTLLYHFFINNDNFANNWKQFKSAAHTGMKNYINYTMSEFYNLNSDIDLSLYIKYTEMNAPINIIEYPINDEQYTKYENFKSSVSFVNNEYIFTILVDLTTGYDIHPQIKIYRK